MIGVLREPKPGDRARLAPATGGRTIRARVATVDGRRVVLRIRPGADPVTPPVGPLRLLLCAEDAAYLWKVEADPKGAGNARELAVTLVEGPLRRLQRRRYFRMQVQMPLLLRESGLDEKGQPRVRILPVRDLSGGGCLCVDPDGLLEPGMIREARLLLEKPAGFLAVQVQVVRRTRAPSGELAAGLRFLGLVERDRERILRALFEEYRRNRSGRSD